MGEDIHQKTFAKSKKTGKWIDTANIDFDANPEVFKHLIPFRSYSLFSLFGSRRSDWKELDASGYGIPNEVKKDLPELAYIHEKNLGGWYGYVWFTRKKLLEEIDKYIDCLSSPEKYYADFDEDIRAEHLADLEEFSNALEDWKNEANALQEMLKEMKDKLKEQEWYFEEYKDIIDFDDVIYMFWFDN